MESLPTSNLMCKLCKLPYNLKNREPIILYCCRKTACRNCVEKEMIKSEDKEIVH